MFGPLCVYVRFQFGPLRLKNFKLAPYVTNATIISPFKFPFKSSMC
jgi:hypothetical protein